MPSSRDQWKVRPTDLTLQLLPSIRKLVERKLRQTPSNTVLFEQMAVALAEKLEAMADPPPLPPLSPPDPKRPRGRPKGTSSKQDADPGRPRKS